MVNVRPPSSTRRDLPDRARLHVLLTEDRPQTQWHWTHQLTRLLEHLGVASHLAHSGREALELAEQFEIHAAIVDLATPLSGTPGGGETPGRGAGSELWLIDLLRRLPSRPPIVVIRGRVYDPRQVDRQLAEALRLGAFSVLNKPIDLEQVLRVFQRLVDRRYHGAWPTRVTGEQAEQLRRDLDQRGLSDS